MFNWSSIRTKQNPYNVFPIVCAGESICCKITIYYKITKTDILFLSCYVRLSSHHKKYSNKTKPIQWFYILYAGESICCKIIIMFYYKITKKTYILFLSCYIRLISPHKKYVDNISHTFYTWMLCIECTNTRYSSSCIWSRSDYRKRLWEPWALPHYALTGRTSSYSPYSPSASLVWSQGHHQHQSHHKRHPQHHQLTPQMIMLSLISVGKSGWR